MAYASLIILKLPLSNEEALPDFIEACLRDGVKLIAVAGEGALDVEDEIDAQVVGEAGDDDRLLMTSAHEVGKAGIEASLKEATTFCEQFLTETHDRIEVVTL